jgi:hypothetical protein
LNNNHYYTTSAKYSNDGHSPSTKHHQNNKENENDFSDIMGGNIDYNDHISISKNESIGTYIYICKYVNLDMNI